MNVNKGKKNHRLVEKHCAFVDLEGNRCKTIFFGTGKSLFCAVHRKPIYRKIIDRDKIAARKKVIIANTANVVMNHKYSEPTTISMPCACCKKTFELIVYPSVYIYPKYCPTHRNQYRRERYLESCS